MLKNLLKPYSPINYFVAYVAAFAGAAIFSTIMRKIEPYPQLTAGILLALTLIVIGTTVICERHILSRITSAGILLVLATMAIKFGVSPIPSSVILLLVLGVAWMGSQKIWHNKSDTRLTAIRSFIILTVSLTLIVLFTCINTMLANLASCPGCS